MAARSDLTSHSPGMPTVLGADEEEAEGEVVLTVGEVVLAVGEVVLTVGEGEVPVACVLSLFQVPCPDNLLLQGRGGDRGRGRGGARGGMRTGAIAASEGKKITF